MYSWVEATLCVIVYMHKLLCTTNYIYKRNSRYDSSSALNINISYVSCRDTLGLTVCPNIISQSSFH